MNWCWKIKNVSRSGVIDIMVVVDMILMLMLFFGVLKIDRLMVKGWVLGEFVMIKGYRKLF